MPIWFKENLSLDDLQPLGKGTMGEHIGIEWYEVGENFLKARMPVDHRTKQPPQENPPSGKRRGLCGGCWILIRLVRLGHEPVKVPNQPSVSRLNPRLVRSETVMNDQFTRTTRTKSIDRTEESAATIANVPSASTTTV